jgi:hypothetical protein
MDTIRRLTRPGQVSNIIKKSRKSCAVLGPILRLGLHVVLNAEQIDRREPDLHSSPHITHSDVARAVAVTAQFLGLPHKTILSKNLDNVHELDVCMLMFVVFEEKLIGNFRCLNDNNGAIFGGRPRWGNVS